MILQIHPQKLSGEAAAIPSKSVAHRMLIASSLSDRPTHLPLDPISADIAATLRCLDALGAMYDGTRISPITGHAESPTLPCGESGSTLRFLLPLAALFADHPTFTGTGRLPARPIAEYLDCLQSQGMRVSDSSLPLTVICPPRAGEYRLPGNVSSQYVSGLLFTLPLLDGDSTIRLTTPLESADYVTMTLQVLHLFGITVHPTQNGWDVPGNQHYRSPGALEIEGDWSNAAFFLAAGALGAPVTVHGLSRSSTQGDRAILPLLQEFGARISICGDAITVSPGALHGISVHMASIPDLLPILAVIAAGAQGETELHHAGRLRLKESDRLASTAAMICALGGDATVEGDRLRIRGSGALRGGEVDCQNDHRIAMAASIAGSICKQPVILRGAQAVEKSYPDFFAHYQSLGGSYHVIDLRN